MITLVNPALALRICTVKTQTAGHTHGDNAMVMAMGIELGDFAWLIHTLHTVQRRQQTLRPHSEGVPEVVQLSVFGITSAKVS